VSRLKDQLANLKATGASPIPLVCIWTSTFRTIVRSVFFVPFVFYANYKLHMPRFKDGDVH
jgi:hypothetical protein